MSGELKDRLEREAARMRLAPDGRERVLRRVRQRSTRRRVGAGIVGLAVTAALVGTLVVVRAGTDETVPGGEPTGSSGLVADGTLRCTVRLPSDLVVPGEKTGATFVVENVSERRVQIPTGTNGYTGWLVFSSGTDELQDSQKAHSGIEGPAPFDQPLGPGEEMTIGVLDIPVLWPGPLTVTPHCVDAILPTLGLDVVNGGDAPDPDDAVDVAVSAIGDRLSSCTPTENGEWVLGTVPTPQGPAEARCGAVVIENPGFDVVVVADVSPPDAPEVDLRELPSRIEAVPIMDFPSGTSVRLSWWVVVVTSAGRSCVARAEIATSDESESYSTGETCDPPPPDEAVAVPNLAGLSLAHATAALRYAG